MLDDSSAFACLAKVRIMSSKTLCKGWLNMSHEYPSNINWIILKIIEGPHGINKGCVVDLSTKPDGNGIVINVALPDVLENRVWLHRISWYQHGEQLLVDSVGCQLDHKCLQVAVHHRAIRLTGCQVEGRLEEVKRAVLMRFIKDVTLNLVGKRVRKLAAPRKVVRLYATLVPFVN
jgi:hypothetical protein